MYSFCGSSIWSSYQQSTFHRLRASYNNAYRILFNLRRRVSISSTLVQNNIQWTPLNVITFVNTKNDNNNRLITLTEKMKIAILSFIRRRKNKK